ncbi:sodium ion-translocating decarboxylase subunit beta, partial [Klebsiella pneumoniae]|nr:sodium ion-translocating decarboxylase subunit beta [Klebsiella pneumoniae]
KSAQIREILISESAWEEMTCLFAPSLMQVNFLQPVYNFTFSNGLIACIVFFGIGAMSDISFILLRPWASIVVALFAEAGTFAALLLGIEVFGLPANEAASIATIGGADGPMVLFASLILAPNLFVPIAIIAYLYLSLTYAGYPYLVRLLVPKKYRGMEVEIDYPTVSKKAKFIFTVCACLLLCLLLPVAAPLILSFFLGIAIKEAEIEPFQKLLESTLTYTATLFLGLLLGTLCEAQTILDPKVAIILILGIGALAISAVGALLGGWFIWFISKGRYNPAIGIAGVSCLPTTAKIAQKEVNHENPYAIILPLAMGAGVSGLIVSAIATGIFISTLFLLN